MLAVDLEARQLARVGVELEGREDDVAVEPAMRIASSRIASIGTVFPRRDDSCCVITTFASLASSRCATAGAAKPEKIGTWIAPTCAIACEAIATSGDIGRKIADAVARLDAERDEPLGEPRHVARQLGERQLAARAVLAEADRGERVGAARAPSGGRSCARSRRVAPTNQVAHCGAARVVDAPRSQGARTRAPCPRCTSGQNHSGSCHERRCSSAQLAAPARRSEPRRVRVLDRRLVGPPDHLRHAASVLASR